MKFFTKDKYGERFIATWKNGYIQWYQEYGQFLDPAHYNWLTFTFFHFDIDYSKMAGDDLTIELGLLGFMIRFYHHIRDTEKTEELKKRIKEVEKK